MTLHNALDRKPGPIPDIQFDGDNVTFRLTVCGTPANTQLILRCDAEGEVFAAIASPRIVPKT
jgi:hypothetical protein